MLEPPQSDFDEFNQIRLPHGREIESKELVVVIGLCLKDGIHQAASLRTKPPPPVEESDEQSDKYDDQDDCPENGEH